MHRLNLADDSYERQDHPRCTCGRSAYRILTSYYCPARLPGRLRAGILIGTRGVLSGMPE